MHTDIKRKRADILFKSALNFCNYYCRIQKRIVKFQKSMQKINENIFQLEIIYEMLFIQEKKPKLNTQSDSIRAKLFSSYIN